MKIQKMQLTVLLAASAALAGGLRPSPIQAQGKAKAAVSAPALELLQQMGGAYQALESYSGAIKVEETKAGDKAKVSGGTIQWRRPNLFKVEFTNASGTTSAASDGTTLFASTSTDKVRYTKSPATKGQDALSKALAGTGAASLLLPTLLSGQDLAAMLGLGGDKNTTSLALGRADKVAGEAVDLVIATQPNANGMGSTQYSFALGHDDHLLRQVKVSSGGEGRPFSLRATETLSDIKAASKDGGEAGVLAAADFAFAPPGGAEEVLSLQAPRYGATLKLGGKPFDFQAIDVMGKPLSLDQFKGKVVLLDFWATWCPPCRAEMPSVIAAYNRYCDEGFDIVGVSLDANPAALSAYIQENGMRWRQVFDGKAWDSRVPGIFEVRSIPFSLLIGRDGKIAAMNPRGEALVPAIEAALDQPQP